MRVPNNDRQGWPEIGDQCVICGNDAQIEETRIREYDKSPSSAHLRKPVPLPWPGPGSGDQSMVTEYFEKDVVGECLGCRALSSQLQYSPPEKQKSRAPFRLRDSLNERARWAFRRVWYMRRITVLSVVVTRCGKWARLGLAKLPSKDFALPTSGCGNFIT